jgi:hypothetical protein
MYQVEHKVGRLVELRIKTPLTAEEYSRDRGRTGEIMMALKARPVLVVDLRKARVMPGQVSDLIVDSMRRGVGNLERGSILLPPDNAVFTLQIERMLREVKDPVNKAFREVTALEAWMNEVLSPLEQARLHQFLEEG